MEKRFILILQNSKTIINAEMMENVACCHVVTYKEAGRGPSTFLRVKKYSIRGWVGKGMLFLED